MKEVEKEIEIETERRRERPGHALLTHFHGLSLGDWCRGVKEAFPGNDFKRPLWEGGNSLCYFFCPCAPWTVLSVPCSALMTHRYSAQVERGCQWGRSSAMSECNLIDVQVETLELFSYLYSIVTPSKGHIWFCVILVTWTNIYFYTDFSTNACTFNWILFPVEIAF